MFCRSLFILLYFWPLCCLSFIKLLILTRFMNKYDRHTQFLFLISRFLKTSPLTQLGQMNRNLVGSIYGMSSIKIAHFVRIRSQTWPSQAILVSEWLIAEKRSSPLKPSSQMNRNLVGSTYGRFCIKCQQNRMRGERHRLSPLSL